MERICKKCGGDGPFPKQGRLCKKCDAARKAEWYQKRGGYQYKPQHGRYNPIKHREQKDKKFSTSFLAFLMDAETE